MYKLSPGDVGEIITGLETNEIEHCHDNKDLIEMFKSIDAVMFTTNMDYVYIIGRDPNKL